MRLPFSRRRATSDGVLRGIARVDADLSRLLPRLRPGDVVVTSALDLDGVTAARLSEAGVLAVVNTALSSTGRFPNTGPARLLDGGVVLLDDVDSSALLDVPEGQPVGIDGETLLVGRRPVARGTRVDAAWVETALEQGRLGLRAQVAALSANAAGQLQTEHELLLDGTGLPQLGVTLSGLAVLVVLPGQGLAIDLRDLRRYVRDARPLVVAVGAAVDDAIAAGLRPVLVVGEPWELSEAAVGCGAEVVLRDPTGEASAAAGVLEDRGVSCRLFRTALPSAPATLLLVNGQEPEVLVVAGGPRSLSDLLEAGAQGMASGVLVGLRLAGRPVAAASVARLHRSSVGAGPITLLVVSALAVLGVTVGLLTGAFPL